MDVATTTAGPVDHGSPGTSATIAAAPQAVVPRLMKFSGALHDAAGKPLTGAVDVTFSLYGTESGGSPLWFETQSVQADELGRYTALLGAMHSDGLPIELFTSGEVRWLGIQVGSEAEQQPRVLLVSVPYALKAGDAETLGGKPASAYMLSETQSGSTATITSSTGTTNTAQTGSSSNTRTSQSTSKSPLTACSSVTSDGTAAPNSITLFTTACNIQSANLVQFNGNLGFGTTTPQARLHIFGPDNTDSDARFNFILGDSTPATAGTGGGILFSGYYNGTTSKAGLANIRGVKENATQGDYASAMVFDTRANGGNQTERMRITSAGNLGIGTSTPAAKLEVNGTSQFDGNITITGTNSISGYGGTFSGAGGGVVGQDTNVGGVGLIGSAPATTGPGVGVEGVSKGDNAAAVLAKAISLTGLTNGVHAISKSSGGLGVFAEATSLMGVTYGVQGNSSSPNGTGVFGVALANSGPATGVQGQTASASGNGIYGVNTALTGGNGIYGYSAATSGTANGVYGVGIGTTSNGLSGNATSGSGFANGVYAQTASPNGNGVYGVDNASTGGTGVTGVTNATSGGNGVYGQSSNSTSNGVYGLNNGTGSGGTGVTGQANASGGTGTSGISTAASGFATGLYGQAANVNATAELLNNTASGNIIIGQAAGVNKFRVDGTGKGFFDGGTQSSGADFAESMAVRGGRSLYEPGDLLVIDPTGHRRLAISRTPYSSHVAGIFSTKPGVLATPHNMDDGQIKDEVPLAIVGIVPCKVTTQNGPIQVGDLLVSSSLPGYAMKGTKRARMLGAVVGKALEPLPNGRGVIQVLVTLQ